MTSDVKTPEAFINSLSSERKEAVSKLRKIVLDNLPKGFVEIISNGMLGYVVPHSLYPDGYHCNPKLPLPFINIGSQKNFVALYHMGIYAKKDLLEWFVTEYPNYSKRKLDMGKSCIRFKKMDAIPYKLIGELVAKVTAKEWIMVYERVIKKK